MAYLCPVCSAPQADAEHLANHLAFTAMLRGEGHGEWLDEHVTDWEEMDPEALGPEVVEYAEEDETEIESDGHEHGHDRPGVGNGLAQRGGAGRESFPSDPESQQILAEAEELTRQMREDEGADEQATTEGSEDDE